MIGLSLETLDAVNNSFHSNNNTSILFTFDSKQLLFFGPFVNSISTFVFHQTRIFHPQSS